MYMLPYIAYMDHMGYGIVMDCLLLNIATLESWDHYSKIQMVGIHDLMRAPYAQAAPLPLCDVF